MTELTEHAPGSASHSLNQHHPSCDRSTGDYIRRVHLFIQKCGFGPVLDRCLSSYCNMATSWDKYEKYIRIFKKKTLSQNEGTAKAEESSRLQCLWGFSFLECILGRILVDGRTNRINIVQNNIYCCWKLLSAMLGHGFTVKRPPINRLSSYDTYRGPQVDIYIIKIYSNRESELL